MTKLTKRARLVVGVTLAALIAGTAHAAPPAKVFGELPIAFDADLSLDGKRLAMILNVQGQYIVATRDMTASNAELKGSPITRDIKPQYVRWVNNGRYFVSFLKAENYDGTPYSIGHIYTRSLDEKSGRLLLKSREFRQFNNVVVDWLKDDPDHVLMSFTEQKTNSFASKFDDDYDPFPNVYKVDVKKGRNTRILEGRTDIYDWMADPSGTPRVGTGRDEGGVAHMDILDPQTGKWKTDKDFPGLEADTPIFTVLKDGKELITGDYNGRDTLGLYIYDLQQKKITRELFHNDDYDASGVVTSTDGETVVGAKYIADDEETELLGKYGTVLDELRAKFPGFSVRFVDQAEDGDTVIVRMSAPYEPGGMFMYKAGDSAPTLLEKMYSGLQADDMGNVMSLNYTARDGQKIPAYVTLPPMVTSQAQLRDLPFIVLPHGGPYGRDVKRFDYLAQFFATRGYGVMQMNFRGSEGYGKSFKDAGRDNWIVMQEDVEDATKFLFEKGYADPNRTCIAGWSYGGYAALMGAAKDTEKRYSCVVAMAALTDIEDAKKDLKRYRGGKFAAKEFFGEAMQDKDIRRANSPGHVAENIKVPVFLAHGDQDQNVQFDQFTRMQKAMKKANVDATYMAFEDEDHYLSLQKNREAFFVGVETFLLKVNGPSEFMKK